MTTAAGVPRPPSIFGVFRNRNFVFLWLAEFINEMGTAIMQLAASLYVFQATGSTLSVGMVMIVSAAPSLLFGLVAGVFVDRYDRRRIMIIVTLVQGLVILAVPPLLSSGLGPPRPGPIRSDRRGDPPRIPNPMPRGTPRSPAGAGQGHQAAELGRPGPGHAGQLLEQVHAPVGVGGVRLGRKAG